LVLAYIFTSLSPHVGQAVQKRRGERLHLLRVIVSRVGLQQPRLAVDGHQAQELAGHAQATFDLRADDGKVDVGHHLLHERRGDDLAVVAAVLETQALADDHVGLDKFPHESSFTQNVGHVINVTYG
jgi:hypothetical protein